MRPSRPTPSSLARAAALLALVLTIAAATSAAPRRSSRLASLPPIVFVARNPIAGEPGAIPGLGPHHRAVVTGGRLLMRERDGRVRELLPAGAFFDVSDPSVSPGARRIAFAGVTHADSAWRLWVVGVDGSDLRPVMPYDAGLGAGPPVIRRLGARDVRFDRFDDLDPCWTNDTTLVFASTRYPQRAQYADVRVTNLFSTRVDPARGGSYGTPRLTAERNGAEEPTMDWARGRIVFSRWWFNRHRAADDSGGITTDSAHAMARDTVNLWQTMEMSLSYGRTHLAAGDLRTRRGSMGYQPAVLADGAIAATYAANLGLSPGPGGTGVHVLPPRFGRARRLAGAIVAGRAGDVYGDASGLAPPSACSPAGLPDGRVLFSYDPGARGDFGLYVAEADGSRLERVLDLPGTLELDAAPVVTRRTPPREPPLTPDDFEEPDRAGSSRRFHHEDRRTPPTEASWFTRASRRIPLPTFRFHDLDVFADGPAGSPMQGAAPRTEGARIRFFATLARPERDGGDSAILIRESPVGPGGEVNESGLPADTPLFEQLVGPDGRVLMTAHGPAHVAGSNAGVAGRTSRCIGCHLGHSTLPVETRAGLRKATGR